MKYIAILLSCIFFMASTCKNLPLAERYYSIEIINNSNQKIYFFDSQNFPDTSLTVDKPYFSGAVAHSTGSIDKTQEWQDIISSIPSDTLTIFILSNDTVNTYPWETIRGTYNILKRYDLSLQDLENSNWTITYP